jgi:hypothetical protein
MDGRGPPRRFASIASCAPLLAGRAGACAAALGRHRLLTARVNSISFWYGLFVLLSPFFHDAPGGVPLPSPLLFCSVLFLCVCSLPTAAGARTPEEEEGLLFVAAATAPPNPTEPSSPFCSRRATRAAAATVSKFPSPRGQDAMRKQSFE